MMEKLKPCPFCGAEAKLWQTKYHYGVECSKSDKDHIVQIVSHDRWRAIKMWNRRTDNG